MKDNGFKWLLVKVAHGSQPVNLGFIGENDWLRSFHNRGIFVGGWGWLDKDPISEANAASTAIKSLRLDFYVANAEATHKADSGGNPAFSRVFVEHFRQLHPRIIAGFSTFWGTTYYIPLGDTRVRAGHEMDFVSWSKGNFKFLPQSYPNDFPDATVPATQDHANRAHWDKRLVHPTIGIYDGQSQKVTALQYVDQLYEAKKKGFTIGYSVYNAENMKESDFQILGAQHHRLGQTSMRNMTAAI